MISIEQKILRAHEHLRAADLEIGKYLKVCRDTMALPVKVNPTKDLVRLTFEPMDDPDPRISVIIGDCLHNSRCVLDHLWKRLGGEKRWPIFGGTEGDGSWRAQRAKKLDGIPVKAHAIIDALQPCTTGQRAPEHLLSILNDLANADKHDSIHLTKPFSYNTVFTFTDKDTGESVSLRPPVVFRYDTEVIINDVPKGRVKPGMNVKIRGQLFVTFKERGAWGDAPVQDVLYKIIEFLTVNVLGNLASFTK